MSKVYFHSLKTNHFNTPCDIVAKLCSKINFAIINKGEHVALKIHFGEFGNFNYIKPQFLIPLIDKLKKNNAKPFLTDTNTLYTGMRTEAVEHITCAIKNGFGYDALQIPIIIADGIKGHDHVSVEINTPLFSHVKIASNIFYADHLICLSHFKLHDIAGFGGSIKNLGMGSASKTGKYEIHSDLAFKINKKCIGCGKCLRVCAHQAIDIENKKAAISKKCVGCGNCLLVCNRNAILADYSTKGEKFLKKLSEYALGAIKDKKNNTWFFNFLTNIAPVCDCVNYTPESLMGDIGILLSNDPVACDQASIDLLKKYYSKNCDIINEYYPNVNYEVCLDYSEKIGLGKREYEFIDVSKDEKTDRLLKLAKIAKDFHKK